MSIDTLHRMDPVPTPGRIGQATAVEQSRAVAEVAAAVQVAQACPRSLRYAVDEMRRSCQQMKLAERAFYRFNRGDGQVSGPSVYLARELARCWGNFQSGIAELRRDDDHGQSEMQAWAWDVQTNSRASTTFIVPHARDTKKGRKELVDLRDIYENNANAGARRLREMILGLLPQWYVEEAKDLCTRTLEAGNGDPLELRVAKAVKAFDGIGISVDRLEKRIGHPTSAWTPQDIATLTVIFTSIRRGEIRIDDEFEAPRVSAEDITGPAQPDPTPAQAASPQANASRPAPKPDTPAEDPAPTPQVQRMVMPISKGRLDLIKGAFEKHDLGGRTNAARADRMKVLSALLERQITDPRELTSDEGQFVLDHIGPDSGRNAIAQILGWDIPTVLEETTSAADDQGDLDNDYAAAIEADLARNESGAQG